MTIYIHTTPDPVDEEPMRVQVTRWRCPFCGRSHSGRSRARQHIARCWYNPAARSCKTCVHFQEATGGCFNDPYCNCSSPESCSAGVDVGQALPVGCPLWKHLDREAL